MRELALALLFTLSVQIQSLAQQQDFLLYLPLIVKECDNMLLPCFDDNSWKIIQPVESWNYVLNPSAETTGNFAAIATATVTRVTTSQKYGVYSYRVQNAAIDDGIELTLLTLTNTNHYVTVRATGTFTTLSASLDGGTTVKPMTKIDDIDSDWALYGVAFQPAEATGATTLEITSNGASDDFNVDGVQVEPLPYWTTYIDGTQDGCEWLGAEHAASSHRSPASKAGGKVVDLFEEYDFQIQKIVGAGASPITVNTDSYAILPGGEFNSEKIESRDWQIIGKFISNTEKELHAKRKALRQEFLSLASQPTQIWFTGAETQKEIGVHYAGGLEGDLAAFYGDIEIVEDELYMERELFTEKASIQVKAPNPYFLEIGESAAVLDTNDNATFRIVAGRLRSTGQWDPLGPPDALGTYGNAFTLAEDREYIYIGGNFTNFDNIASADYIVRYHKQTGVYSAMGTGMDDFVNALVIAPDGKVYAGGLFTSAGGVANTNRIAYWDPVAETWNSLSAGATNDDVSCLALGLDGTLYVGGDFTTIGGVAANRIAAYDGSVYSALGTGMDASPLKLEVHPLTGDLYAVGFFTTANGVTVNFITYWNGSTFVDMGGADVVVRALAFSTDGTLYVGGNFTTIGGITATRVASWNGTAFSTLSSGVNATVDNVTVGIDNLVYFSGQFTEAGDISVADRVAIWNGSTWVHVDLDLPGSPLVYDIILSRYTDPVINQKYDIFASFNTTGTGNYGGLVTAENEGSVPVYPKVTFTRSGGTSAVIETLRNELTIRQLWLDYSLQDGESLVIDLAPTAKSVISFPFNQPKSGAVLANSDFGIWALEPGDNDVTSFVNVAGGPTVTATMLWRDAFDGYD